MESVTTTKRGLSANALKTIAILAMFCDHFAYVFLDFYTFPAQVIHVIGRLTIPIMCFFVAEGLRKTSNLAKYFLRMLACFCVSILPFFWLFSDMYRAELFGVVYYRQNYILELIIGMCAVLILRDENRKKLVKVLLLAPLAVFSFVLGAWPLIPAIFICIFYFYQDQKKRYFWVIVSTCVMELVCIVVLLIDRFTGFANIGWPWYRNLYLLGFVLALPLLSLYNGKRGSRSRLHGYVFYVIYPLHLLVLTVLKHANVTPYGAYVLMFVICTIICFYLAERVRRFRPSNPQVSMTIFYFATVMLLVGFIFEITAKTLDAAVVAVKFQYLTQYGIILAYTFFLADFCKAKVPRFIFILEYGFCAFFMILIFTIGTNTWFYKDMWMDESRMFPKFTSSPSFGFYAYYTVILLLIFICVGACGIRAKRAKGYARRRAQCVMIATFFPAIELLLYAVGVTNGYDFIALALVATLFLLTYALERYGYFSSIEVANENMLLHGEEGIIITDEDHSILFMNNKVKTIIPHIKEKTKMEDYESIRDACMDEKMTVTLGGKRYDIRRDILRESDSIEGYMFWLIDMTEHYRNLELIKTQSEIDFLTGLYNRRKYEELLGEKLENRVPGTHVMFDLDNFKGINDEYGHKMGDQIIIEFGEILTELAKEEDFFCRIGGDEFCGFLNGCRKKKELTDFAEKVEKRFRKRLMKHKLYGKTSASIGFAIFEGDKEETFSTIYQRADKALYLAKEKGKNGYAFL